MSQFIDRNSGKNLGSNCYINNNNINVNKVLTQNSQQLQHKEEEEFDERKKLQRFQNYKLQQKRLQEMHFTKDNTNSSADHLINNIIKKVDSEAKLDKRINASHKQTFINPVFNTSSVSSISGSVVTPINTNAGNYYPQYSNIDSIQQNMSQFVSTQPLMTSLNPNQKQFINNYQINGQTYPQTLSLNTNQVFSQMFSNPVSEQNYSTNETFNDLKWKEKTYSASYTPNTSLSQITQNQSMTKTMHNLNSDPNAFKYSMGSNASSQSTYSAKSNVNPVINSEIQSSIKRELPFCFTDYTKMPTIYLKVWNYVRINEMSSLCDTNKLYGVLLSGGLPQTLLAQLWTHVNNTIPGQLTRQELHMILVLIALIQKNSSNPIEEVYKLNSLPIPNLQFFPDSLETQNLHYIETENDELPKQRQPQNKLDQQVMSLKDKFSIKNEQILANYDIDDNEDDFADFKSADFSSSEASDQINKSSKQSSSVFITSNVVNEDEFDDLKHAITYGSNALNSVPIIENKIESENISKSVSLTNALFSNISAITSISSINYNNDRSSSPSVTIPSISITNSINSGENILELNTHSTENSETITIAESNSGSVDKYRVFRDMLIENNSSKTDDFGDFLSHATNYDAESVDSLQFGHQDIDNDSFESIRHQVMQTCRQVIHKAFNVLVVNHGEESVTQAINSNEGKNFALDLYEVYGIAKRVYKHLKTNDKTNDNFVKLMSDIENTWNTISSVFTKASINIELNDENKSENNFSSQCAICCSETASEQTLLTFAGYEYHSSCANLWLNCINSTLPQPIIHCR